MINAYYNTSIWNCFALPYLFVIYDHVDSIYDVPKKHNQNLKGNDFPHKKNTNGFFSRKVYTEILVCSWYKVVLVYNHCMKVVKMTKN